MPVLNVFPGFFSGVPVVRKSVDHGGITRRSADCEELVPAVHPKAGLLCGVPSVPGEIGYVLTQPCAAPPSKES